ncbi:MAG: MFS transporter [Capsulimonadaceae bacterium]|nr:MFS transporter [Capsulimonadaceae bacterium]
MNSNSVLDPSGEPETDAAPLQPAMRWSVGTLSYTKKQLFTLFCWLLWGDFAWSMKDRSVGTVATLVIKRFHASDVLLSLFLVALPAAIGIILGPVISFRSDRLRGRYGRRIPYLAITTPFAALAMIGLGVSPFIGQKLHALVGAHSISHDQCVLLTFGLFWAAFEIASVIANAVFGALINDVVPHEFLGRFYGLFRALSLIAGMIFNYKLLGLAEVHTTALFVSVGLLYGIGFAFMCVKVKEGDYPPPSDMQEGQYPGFIESARLYMKECFTNSYYLWLIAALVVSGLVFLPVNLYSLPFAQSLHISMDAYGKYLALTYLISLSIAYFLGYLADRFHPLRLGIYTMIAYAAVTLWGGFYTNAPTMYAAALVAHGVLSGTFFTCTASLGQRLFPKLRFAQFASAAGIVGAVSNMVIAPAIGLWLDHAGHDYHYTYFMGFGLSVLAVILLTIVYSRFLALGGLVSYAAPE